MIYTRVYSPPPGPIDLETFKALRSGRKRAYDAVLEAAEKVPFERRQRSNHTEESGEQSSTTAPSRHSASRSIASSASSSLGSPEDQGVPANDSDADSEDSYKREADEIEKAHTKEKEAIDAGKLRLTQQQSEGARGLTVIDKRLEELQGLKHDLIKQLKQVRAPLLAAYNTLSRSGSHSC